MTQSTSDKIITNDISKAVPGLYLVGTPIGNLGDMTFRAVEILKNAHVVYCEDTRVSGKLLAAFSIKTPMRVYNDHAGEKERSDIIAMIKQGHRVALISDAGMPLISDPGFKLVRSIRDEGLYVTVIPSASSVLSALCLSALPSDRFYFGGFLPHKEKARADILQDAVSIPATLIFFETAPRLLDTLKELSGLYATREMAVVREITKMFEETRKGMPQKLLDYYQEHGEPKGEIVLVISPPCEDAVVSKDDLDTIIRDALGNYSLRDAVDAVMAQTGLKRKDVYNRALEIKKEVF